MSQAGRGLASWTSMNENLMALLEAVLTLAASDASANNFRASRASSIKPGGYSEDIFLNLSEEEQEELSCGICYQVLKEAMQCPNRHKFCHSCLVVWSTTGQYANRVRCPVCRCQGYYLHDHELDSRIEKKRVRCNVENCRWTGTLKYLGVHSNTHSGAASSSVSQTATQVQRENESDMDEDEDDDDDEDMDDNILELPFLGRATPQLPHRSQSRFNGTGLQARSMMTTAGAAAASVSRESNRGGADPTVQTTTTSLLDRGSVGGAGTVLERRPRHANTAAASIEAPVLLRERRNANNTATESSSSITATVGGGGGILLRERRNANTLNANTDSSPSPALNREARVNSAHRRALRRNSNASAEASTSDTPATTTRQSVRQRVHPIRRANRITISHTNNNSSNSTTGNNVLYSSEGGAPTTPRQPRPPSAPRPPNQATRRNLPGLSAASGSNTRSQAANGHQSNSPSPTHIIRAPPTFNSTTASRGVTTNPSNNGGEFQDQLRESRERLEGLMTSFSGELERSRQEMAVFQMERERQRREQLTEVRELGRRLGQVASELRQLLNQRPRLRPDSDD